METVRNDLFGRFSVELNTMRIHFLFGSPHQTVFVIGGCVDCVHFQFDLFVYINYITTRARRYDDGIPSFDVVFMSVDYAFAVAALETKKLVNSRMRFEADIFAWF